MPENPGKQKGPVKAVFQFCDFWHFALKACIRTGSDVDPDGISIALLKSL